jgi:hypothetical protein
VSYNNRKKERRPEDAQHTASEAFQRGQRMHSTQPQRHFREAMRVKLNKDR